ncbi:MAG: hypothetical protein V3S72_02870, partial [Desulfobacterales bacterium]
KRLILIKYGIKKILISQVINHERYQIIMYHIVVLMGGMKRWKGEMVLMHDMLPNVAPATYFNL